MCIDREILYIDIWLCIHVKKQESVYHILSCCENQEIGR